MDLMDQCVLFLPDVVAMFHAELTILDAYRKMVSNIRHTNPKQLPEAIPLPHDRLDTIEDAVRQLIKVAKAYQPVVAKHPETMALIQQIEATGRGILDEIFRHKKH